MKFFTEDGWVNMREIRMMESPFIFIVGARGIGKTYGGLLDLLENYKETGQRFIYMRRTDAQADVVSSAEGNPFNEINNDTGSDVRIRKVNRKLKGFYLGEEQTPMGLIMALSTFTGKRSVSFSAYDYLFFDEFIPEAHERPIKHEAEAFFHVIETIGRNRELQGRPPLKVICASNSNTVDNPLFLELGLVTRALKMADKKIPVYTDKERGFSLIMPFASPISKKKQDTALYRLTKNSPDFQKVAIGNEFNDDVSENVKSMNLTQYSSMVQVGELYIYSHKTERRYYISSHKQGTFQNVYSSGEMDLTRFKTKYSFLWFAHLRRELYFESYIEQLLFEKYFSI